MQQRRAWGSSQLNARQGGGRLTVLGSTPATGPVAAKTAAAAATSAAAAGAGKPAAAASTPPAKPKPASLALPVAEAEPDDEVSPLSKFKDWAAVERLEGSCEAPPLPLLPAAGSKQPAADRITSASMAADVTQLVNTLLASTQPPGSHGSGGGSGSAELCLAQLADAAVLSLAPDRVLAQLLDGLGPWLRYSPADRCWAAPVGDALGPLQAACLDRLSRTTLPCDADLAAAAGRFFSLAIRQGGGGLVSDELLDAAAAYVHRHCRQLGSEVLAALHVLLVTARYRPRDPVDYGNAVTERLLCLNAAAKGSLPLPHLADIVEALAQLRCVDGLSAAPIVNLAAERSRTLEEGGALKAAELVQLSRLMNSVAVIAATTHVQTATLLAASAIWHLLVVRSEALALRAAADGRLAAPTAACLSKMWASSKLLLTVCRATAAPTFRLPDRLGLAANAAWLEQEQRLVWGLTSAQRRVLAALAVLKVPPARITTDRCLLDAIHVSVAVRMRVAGSNRERGVAILIRDPLRQLMRGPSGGEALGAEQAHALILKAAGWHVVCIDAPSCLMLPRATLADELGALMMGDAARSSLRFAA